jgi:hypothetical protein
MGNYNPRDDPDQIKQAVFNCCLQLEPSRLISPFAPMSIRLFRQAGKALTEDQSV